MGRDMRNTAWVRRGIQNSQPSAISPILWDWQIMSDLETRIDRLESLDAIRQLAEKYALTLDMRDIDMMVTPKVRVRAD